MTEAREQPSAASGPPASPLEERPIVVFFRDAERDLGFGYKTSGSWRDGVFDASPWSTGEFRCDCARAGLLYRTGSFACGQRRFRIERIDVWETGETVYSELPPAQ
ncbi:MAG TPA: hypothetical protein VFZ18_01490 [Longimicrobiaceae bacterium]